MHVVTSRKKEDHSRERDNGSVLVFDRVGTLMLLYSIADEILTHNFTRIKEEKRSEFSFQKEGRNRFHTEEKIGILLSLGIYTAIFHFVVNLT
jgi:hypothetical protein